jgi:hypothetical protein
LSTVEQFIEVKKESSPKMSPKQEYLQPKVVAEKMGVHEETVLRWCKGSNPLHARKINGRWYIPRKNVEQEAA